jgi:hypothetical protein
MGHVHRWLQLYIKLQSISRKIAVQLLELWAELATFIKEPNFCLRNDWQISYVHSGLADISLVVTKETVTSTSNVVFVANDKSPPPKENWIL